MTSGGPSRLKADSKFPAAVTRTPLSGPESVPPSRTAAAGRRPDSAALPMVLWSRGMLAGALFRCRQAFDATVTVAQTPTPRPQAQAQWHRERPQAPALPGSGVTPADTPHSASGRLARRPPLPGPARAASSSSPTANGTRPTAPAHPLMRPGGSNRSTLVASSPVPREENAPFAPRQGHRRCHLRGTCFKLLWRRKRQRDRLTEVGRFH